MKKLPLILLSTLILTANIYASNQAVFQPISLKGTLVNMSTHYWLNTDVTLMPYSGNIAAFYVGPTNAKQGDFFVDMQDNSTAEAQIIEFRFGTPFCFIKFTANNSVVNASIESIPDSKINCALSGDPNNDSLTITISDS